jgi:hypothetical protein
VREIKRPTKATLKKVARYYSKGEPPGFCVLNDDFVEALVHEALKSREEIKRLRARLESIAQIEGSDHRPSFAARLAAEALS